MNTIARALGVALLAMAASSPAKAVSMAAAHAIVTISIENINLGTASLSDLQVDPLPSVNLNVSALSAGTPDSDGQLDLPPQFGILNNSRVSDIALTVRFDIDLSASTSVDDPAQEDAFAQSMLLITEFASPPQDTVVSEDIIATSSIAFPSDSDSFTQIIDRNIILEADDGGLFTRSLFVYELEAFVLAEADGVPMAPIPLPGAAGLLTMAFCGLGLWSRRQRS